MDNTEQLTEEKITHLNALVLELMKAQETTQAFMDNVGRGTGGREMALVNTKIQEARLWAKEALFSITEKL